MKTLVTWLDRNLPSLDASLSLALIVWGGIFLLTIAIGAISF